MKAVEIFNSIRDIPYHIPLNFKDTGIDCIKKHQILFEKLSKEWYEIRYRLCSFNWSDLDIAEKVLAVVHEDRCEHLFLEIKIKNEWKVLDATRDKWLSHILPVNNRDWLSNCKIATDPVIEVYPLEKSKKMMKKWWAEEDFLGDMKKSGPFYKSLNERLEKERQEIK